MSPWQAPLRSLNDQGHPRKFCKVRQSLSWWDGDLWNLIRCPVFDKFSITKIDNSNWEKLKTIFRPVFVKRVGQHFIERQYKEVPSLAEGEEDFASLGHIPYDSEDLMLLLRLFKAGDIVYVAGAVETPEGNLLSQYQYPEMWLGKYHQTPSRKMKMVYTGFWGPIWGDIPI